MVKIVYNKMRSSMNSWWNIEQRKMEMLVSTLHWWSLWRNVFKFNELFLCWGAIKILTTSLEVSYGFIPLNNAELLSLVIMRFLAQQLHQNINTYGRIFQRNSISQAQQNCLLNVLLTKKVTIIKFPKRQFSIECALIVMSFCFNFYRITCEVEHGFAMFQL